MLNSAELHVTDPATPSTDTSVSGAPVTVQNLSLDDPTGTGPDGGTQGGLNSTLTVALPPGGLPPGGSLPVAFTFTVDAGGTCWFTYDTEITQLVD